MTVPVQTTFTASIANGVTTVFPYAFKITAAEDLQVSVGGVVITTDFTVSGVGDELGGSVTFSVAPANGLKVIRALAPLLKRETDYQQFGDWTADVVNNDFDRLWLALQASQQNFARVLKLPIDTTTDQTVADSETQRPGKVVSFDALGNMTLMLPIDLSFATVSAFISTLLDDTDVVAARATLGVPSIADIQKQSAQKFIAGGTADNITGTLSPAITGYTAGLRVTTTPGGANTVTGTTLNLNSLGTKTIKKRSSSGSKVALVAGDYNASGPFDLEYDGTDFILLNPVASSSSVQLQPISASVGSNALTISASALSLDFRSTTLGSGTVTTVSGTPSNLVISSGSTLGTINAVASRIAVLAINNAGTIELAAVNVAGGNDLSETGLISTTAEGGAGAADSASTIYSTTARTNVAYRVIGFVESTQATAGTWATAPSTIQGAGGNAMTGLMTLGHGQTWQAVTGSRVVGTTYYNTTGRPILCHVNGSASGVNGFWSITVNGVGVGYTTSGYNTGAVSSGSFIVPHGGSYSVSNQGAGATVSIWSELR